MAGGKGYAKVYRRIWTDEKFTKLDPTGKLVALYALTSQSNRIGLFRFSRALAAEDLGLSRDRLDTVWDTVCHTVSWGWDSTVSVVWIPSWWKWNPPDNVDALKGYLSDLDDVPSCSLIAKFGKELRHLPSSMHYTVSNTVSHRVSDTVSDTVSSPEPYPEPDKEPEKEPEHENRAASRAFRKPSLEEVEAYCRQRAAEGHNSVDAVAWLDHYEANGWRVGKVPMKDWHAAVRTWERNGHSNGVPKAPIKDGWPAEMTR